MLNEHILCILPVFNCDILSKTKLCYKNAYLVYLTTDTYIFVGVLGNFVEFVLLDVDEGVTEALLFLFF